MIAIAGNWRYNMTALRKEVNELLDNMSEDKLGLVIQIIRGIDELTKDRQSEREEAFLNLERLRKKGTVVDDMTELASYREEKYGK